MHRVVQLLHDTIKGKPAKLRSPHWDRVRDRHIESHPTCAACGRKDHLQVHHIVPFHVDRYLELEPTNLITLCEQSDTKCHLRLGHLGDWKKFNQSVIADAEKSLKNWKILQEKFERARVKSI